MSQIFAFLALVAGFVFAMGLVTHAAGTAQILNSTSNGLTNLFTLELGQTPKTKVG